jgi:L-ascorbate metabolism protein UlaG (beta-lactamase superfamily)
MPKLEVPIRMKKTTLLLLIFLTASCVVSKFPTSDHFDGSRFHNLDPKVAASKSIGDLIKWKFGSEPKDWPSQKVLDNAVPQIQSAVVGSDLRITFVNHATLLIQWKSINILTDPVFSEKLGPLSILNLKRYREVGVPFDQLPKIDYVFISHNHYDHLDLPTIDRLEKRDQPKYVLPLGLSDYLPKSAKARLTELDWWQSLKNETLGLEIFVVPSQHWSKRTLIDTNKSLWAAAVFRAYGRSVYFAGDTGYADHFNMTFEKLGAMDVALLPIGAYEPRWFMKDSHTNPEDAIQAHRDLRAKRSIGMHFGTFRLTDEAIADPERDLKSGLLKNGLTTEDFEVPRNGQTFSL